MKIVCLCGGVGGARAALALYENLSHHQLTFIVNTGDDFTHLGLPIWPDWDTVLYHLAEVQESERGWGRADEGSRVMEELRRFGAPQWFHLGDRDVALHLYRNWRFSAGAKRLEISKELCEAFGVQALVLPLTENGMGTQLRVSSGETMDFQDWFVKEQGRPPVAEVVMPDSSENPLVEGVQSSIEEADCLLFAPSNPYLSLGPMLSHRPFVELLQKRNCPKVAVSPLVGGKALKGPLDKLIESLSPYRGQTAIAHYWKDKVDLLLLPPGEAPEKPFLNTQPCPTMLKTVEQRQTFANSLEKLLEGFV